MNTCAEYVMNVCVCVCVWYSIVWVVLSSRTYHLSYRLFFRPRDEIETIDLAIEKPIGLFRDTNQNSRPRKQLVDWMDFIDVIKVCMSPTTDDINDLARIAAHVATTSRSPSRRPIGRRGHARDVLYPTHTFPRKHKRTQEGEESRPSVS